ncbi:hypothetical protein [Nonomuraea dietziae]|uniref:Uncharacterized protein n=1 Tax=Nonomuraea dietziae TaxID=65515 RepID=A0A7W5YP10_9ACTN|nr:hypothetical protein [Nonomuraea dietziae]MBB3724539.1 hypothetical protein [Nonomuraea dietziae]
MALALKILLGLYILQALIKFINLFAIPYDVRIKRIAAYHRSQASKVFDHILLTLMAVLVALLATVGLEHLSFITGLLVGLTLTQVLFHRFTQPLPPDRTPPPPGTPITTMSYAIQANPRLAWRELVIQTALFAWALVALITQGG